MRLASSARDAHQWIVNVFRGNLLSGGGMAPFAVVDILDDAKGPRAPPL